MDEVPMRVIVTLESRDLVALGACADFLLAGSVGLSEAP
jgi:hypothetical protein